jgi:CheY-like chemotaxis protein
MKFEMSI